MEIGFIGLGSMGLPMARNLIGHGYQVTLYNRTATKGDSLVAEGGKLASHPAGVVTPNCCIISMLAHDAAVEEVVYGKGGIADRLGPGHIHISMSTISPDTSRRLAEFHKEKGADYLVATVSGRPDAAAAQKLWIFLAGAAEAKAKVEKILSVLGQRIFDIGDDPALGNVIKLCGNFLILSAIEALSEAFAFAHKNGLKEEMVSQVFGQSLFACPIYQIYGKILATENFHPGFFLKLGMKDINLLRSSAEKAQVPMPLANLLHERLLSAMAKGRELMDWSAIAMNTFEDAGIIKT